MIKNTILLLALIVSGTGRAATAQRLSVADFFNQATFENMDEICARFYDPEVVFEDPLGTIKGLSELTRYYKHLYENLISIRFVPVSEFEQSDERVFVWTMELRHKAVGSEQLIVVEGVSLLKYKGDRVIYHRDYFDLGKMIYENIPVLGRIIKWVKSKAHG